MRHPMQPVEDDGHGVIRFKENKLISFLLKECPYDLNKLHCKHADGDFNKGDYTQLMQLLGYSVSGYGGLSSSPKKSIKKADKRAAKLAKQMRKEPTLKERNAIAAHYIEMRKVYKECKRRNKW